MPSGFQAFGSAEGYVGSGAPNPDNIPNLVLWAESDNGIVTSGSPAAVDSWADKSVVGNNLEMSTANARPIFVSSDPDLGGAPSLNCSTGVGPFAHKGMKATSVSYGAFTKFFLVTGQVTGAGYYDYHELDANNLDLLVSSTNGMYVERGGVVDQRNPGTWGAYGGTTYKTQRHEYNGTNASFKMFLNGSEVSVADMTVGDPGTTSIAADWYFGVDSSLGTSTGSKWAAILIYARLLSAGEISAVENYLRTKYQHY